MDVSALVSLVGGWSLCLSDHDKPGLGFYALASCSHMPCHFRCCDVDEPCCVLLHSPGLFA